MKLYRKARGKEEVIAEGDFKTLNKRKAQFLSSQRGGVCGRNAKKYTATYRIGD